MRTFVLTDGQTDGRTGLDLKDQSVGPKIETILCNFSRITTTSLKKMAEIPQMSIFNDFDLILKCEDELSRPWCQ